METRILPECYADTALIDVLGYKNSNHQFSIGNTLKALEDKGYNNKIGIAIIDKDKRQPPKLKKEYEQISKNNNLEIRQFKEGKRFVIIHPNFERWTFDQGNNNGIHTSDYGLPKDFEGYRDVICKSQNASKNPKLKNYLNALCQNTGTEQYHLGITIKQLLNEFS